MRFRSAPFVFVLVALLASGCFYSRELAQTRRALERANPGSDLDTKFALAVGPGTLGFAQWLLSVSESDDPDADEDLRRAQHYLRQVRRVRVGVYHVDRFGSQTSDFAPTALDRFDGRGWELAIAAEHEGERVWVLYREAWGGIRDMFVLVQDDRDLVMLRLDGRLDDLLRLALEDYADFDALIEIDFGG